MPYFDERPKRSREDLYGREGELSSLLGGIDRGTPLILLLGLRRTGKTSLLLTALSELEHPSLYLDFRVLEEKVSASPEDLYRLLKEGMSGAMGKERTLVDYLRGVKGVKIAGMEIDFGWRGEERVSLVSLLRTLEDWAARRGKRFVLALDEAQELRKLKGLRFLPVLAYAYDHLPHLTFILSGSQMGLLHRFLRLEDPSSPLYGRPCLEIRLDNFPKEKALEFLRKGFEQAGKEVPENLLRYAVERLDGIPGWLTYFGVEALRRGARPQTVETVMEKGGRLVREELEKFLRERGVARRRYVLILKRLAEGKGRWGEIKNYVESKEGRTLSDRILAHLLQNLLDGGLVLKREEEYFLPDPVLARAVRDL